MMTYQYDPKTNFIFGSVNSDSPVISPNTISSDKEIIGKVFSPSDNKVYQADSDSLAKGVWKPDTKIIFSEAAVVALKEEL